MSSQSSASGEGLSEMRAVALHWLRALCGVSLAFVLLIGTGYLSRPVLKSAWQPELNGWPSLAAFRQSNTAIQGVLIGVMGGMRALTANLIWIKAHEHWAKRDIAGNAANMQLALAIDSRNVGLWQIAANIMAYDWPKWKLEQYEEMHGKKVPAWIAKEAKDEGARNALQLLEQARHYHPKDYRLIVDAALIHRNCLGNTERAAELYYKASQLPGAPYFIARTYGELLKEMKQYRRALDWYIQLHASFPDEPNAQRSVILERIRKLEGLLDVPAWQRYQPEQH